jgi:hypothetical protein
MLLITKTSRLDLGFAWLNRRKTAILRTPRLVPGFRGFQSFCLEQVGPDEAGPSTIFTASIQKYLPVHQDIEFSQKRLTFSANFTARRAMHTGVYFAGALGEAWHTSGGLWTGLPAGEQLAAKPQNPGKPQ